MALGLSAFLLSALFGHPLLQPQVFAPFCAALGVTAGLTQRPRSLSSQSLVVQAAALFYGLSLLWRLG
jgi:hypothetical protein